MLQQATRKLPADPLAFYYLADAAERRAHYDVARQALIDYSALAGEDSDARRRANLSIRVADLSMRVEDFPVAATYYERAAPQLSGDETFLVKLADARWRAGQPDAAKAILDKVLEKHPESVGARNLRAQNPIGAAAANRRPVGVSTSPASDRPGREDRHPES